MRWTMQAWIMPIASAQDMPGGRSPGSAGQFARNSAFGTVAGMLSALASFFASVIVAHALGVEATGVVAFALWIATLAAAIVDFGIQASLARYLPELTAAGRPDETHRLARALWRWLALASSATAVGFAGWAWWRWQSAAISGQDGLIWGLVGLLCAMQALAGFTNGLLRGLQRFDRLALLTIVSLGCQLGGVAIGAIVFGATGAIAGYCAGSAVPAALSLRYAVPGPSPSREIVVRVRRYALYAWAAALSSTFVWSRAEVFFLQRSTGSAAVGLFTVAVTLASLAAQGPMLLTAGLLPYFAQSFGDGDIAKIKEGYATGTRVLAFLVLPACFGLAALLPVMLPMMYGKAFADAVPAAAVLVLFAGIGAISSVATSLIMAMDRSDFVFISGLAAAALAVAAGLTVIPAYGLMGAVWARASIQLVAVVMGSAFMFWRLGFPMPVFDLGRLLLAASVCGLAARGCLMLVPGAASLLLAIPAGAVAYAVSVRALRALRPADAERLRTLCRRLPAKLGAACELAIGWLTSDRPGRRDTFVGARQRSVGDGN
jgi:O-antigen/teichoic acid export membrane protein